MKSKRAVFILLGISLSLTACDINEAGIHVGLSQVSEFNEQAEENNSNNMERIHLSLKKLKDLVKDSRWQEYCENCSISDWKKYEYTVDKTYGEIQISLEDDYDLVVTPHENGVDIDTLWLSNRKEGEAICLYSRDDCEPINTDIDSFVNAEYKLSDIVENIVPESFKLSSKIKLSSRHEQFDFSNFNIKIWESDDYVEPKHGDFVPCNWYALGGIGECAGAFDDYAIFSDGDLVAYDCIDNHMETEFVKKIKTSKYSGCLYKYNIDLFTVSEVAEEKNLRDDETTIDYYVLFFTNGKNIYMEFFNCDYFNENEVIATIE